MDRIDEVEREQLKAAMDEAFVAGWPGVLISAIWRKNTRFRLGLIDGRQIECRCVVSHSRGKWVAVLDAQLCDVPPVLVAQMAVRLDQIVSVYDCAAVNCLAVMGEDDDERFLDTGAAF